LKIGLISDTHIFDNGKLPIQVIDSLCDVDLIFHAGDIFISSVLDELEDIAPVFAARGNGNRDPEKDPRVKNRHIINIEGMCIGLIHNLGVPWLTIGRIFDSNVDIVVFGDTHIATVGDYKGTMLINPGSPTFPGYGKRQPGTVAILEIIRRKAEVNIIQL